jgi:hypothetical protein
MTSGLRWPAPLCKQQSLHVDGVAQNTGAFHRFGALRAGRFGAGLFQGGLGFGFEIELGAGVLDWSGHGIGASADYGELFSGPGSRVAACEAGGSGSPAVQAMAFDSSGSIASILVSAWVHFGHR